MLRTFVNLYGSPNAYKALGFPGVVHVFDTRDEATAYADDCIAKLQTMYPTEDSLRANDIWLMASVSIGYHRDTENNKIGA